MFSGSTEKEQQHKMGPYNLMKLIYQNKFFLFPNIVMSHVKYSSFHLQRICEQIYCLHFVNYLCQKHSGQTLLCFKTFHTCIFYRFCFLFFLTGTESLFLYIYIWYNLYIKYSSTCATYNSSYKCRQSKLKMYIRKTYLCFG